MVGQLMWLLLKYMCNKYAACTVTAIILPYSTKFGGRKHWRIWQLGVNSPKFYSPKFSITLVFYCCSTQSTNVFSAKYILGANPPKFSTAKVLCYMVSTYLLYICSYILMILTKIMLCIDDPSKKVKYVQKCINEK